MKVNPRQARRFAEATGRLAKTYRLDAATLARAMLARMEGVARDCATSRPSAAIATLKQLHVARGVLVKAGAAAKNRAKTIEPPVLKRQNTQHRRRIARQLAVIDAEVAALMHADATLTRRREILAHIPDIAKPTAFASPIETPGLGQMQPGRAASLAGLAPVTRQFGRWMGEAFIRGGSEKASCVIRCYSVELIRHLRLK